MITDYFFLKKYHKVMLLYASFIIISFLICNMNEKYKTVIKNFTINPYNPLSIMSIANNLEY